MSTYQLLEIDGEKRFFNLILIKLVQIVKCFILLYTCPTGCATVNFRSQDRLGILHLSLYASFHIHEHDF